VLNLLWTAIHSQLQQQTNSEFSQLNELRSKDHDYAVTGPKIALGDDTEYYAHCAAVWSRSSEQLHQLCAANGVRYFHFLQPNQYVAGSRPAMSDDERRLIYHEHYSAKAPVEQGYPLLQLEGERLASRGVPFFDLTGLFVDQSERIYRDHCCHFTDLGNEILATRIGEIVLERIAGDR
jgi:hypothetical protein